MNKIEVEKELISVINDLTNPYNEHETEVEAHLLAEDGWRKVPQAEWMPQSDYIELWGVEIIHHYECSNCGNNEYTNDKNYCSNCGAKMKGVK